MRLFIPHDQVEARGLRSNTALFPWPRLPASCRTMQWTWRICMPRKLESSGSRSSTRGQCWKKTAVGFRRSVVPLNRQALDELPGEPWKESVCWCCWRYPEYMDQIANVFLWLVTGMSRKHLHSCWPQLVDVTCFRGVESRPKFDTPDLSTQQSNSRLSKKFSLTHEVLLRIFLPAFKSLCLIQVIWKAHWKRTWF